MTDFKASLSFLQRLDQEERNWRTCRSDLTALLEAAHEAQKVVNDVQKQKEAYEASIKGLEKQLADGNRRVEQLVEQKEKELRADLDARLAASKTAVKEIEEAVTAAKVVKAESENAAKLAMAKREKVDRELADAEGRLAEVRAAIAKLTAAV